MREGEPSRTAFAAAAHRAAHQVLEGGRIFPDPLALRILGLDADTIKREAPLANSTGIRLFIAARSAFAERVARESVERRCVSQIVVLGAGLDTFAYRHDLEAGVRIFEVDHPDTQAWKHRRLAEAAIAIPTSLVYTPVDFERDDLADALSAPEFSSRERTLFIWLGVTPYLTKDAIATTLDFIVSLASGGEVVFDYSEPPQARSDQARLRHEQRAARVAALGEPFISYFMPNDIHAQLKAAGFATIENFGLRSLVEDRLGVGPSMWSMPDRGGRVLHAATV